MSPVFATKRRAEEFQSMVETPTDAWDPRYADVLALVDQLRAVAPPEPRAEFTLALREELLAAADTLLLPSSDTQRLALPPRRTARDRRLAALVGGLAVVGATSSLAVAAQSALPGEMLYPLKRLMENAETGAHLSDEARGVSLLSSATDRLAEVAALTRAGDLGDGDAIASTLTTFSDQSLEASELLLDDYAATGDEASIGELRDFTTTSMDTLAQLEALLPAEAHDELQYAAEVLSEIDAAASRACPSCPGGITEIPAALIAAGWATGPDVTVVPAPVVAAQEPRTGSGPSGGGGPKKGEGDTGGGGTGGGGDGGGGGILAGGPDLDEGDTVDDTGPIEQITDAVTGKGDKGGSGGTTGIDPIDDVIEDVDDALPDLP